MPCIAPSSIWRVTTPSRSRRNTNVRVVRSSRVTVFGAADIDLSDAKLVGKVTRMKVLCLFGAVDIFVRDDIRTAITTLCVFGAMDNEVPAAEAPDPPRLIIEGLVLFGSADAKIRRTLKERLFQFSDSFRTMFGQSAEQKRD